MFTRLRQKFVAEASRAFQARLTAALPEQQTGSAVPIQKETIDAYMEQWLEKLPTRARDDREPVYAALPRNGARRSHSAEKEVLVSTNVAELADCPRRRHRLLNR